VVEEMRVRKMRGGSQRTGEIKITRGLHTGSGGGGKLPKVGSASGGGSVRHKIGLG